jgi:phage tail tape-measure protein
MLNTKLFKPCLVIAAAGLLSAACTTSGATERNAAGGAALGAIAGAVIGNNVGHGDAAAGAAIGAAVGGTAGAIKGCREDGGCGAANANNHRQYYDERAGRYYYYDSRTGRYYWEDGSPR